MPTPAFLASQSSDSITFDVPNERSRPMTGFVVTAPDGLVIHHAASPEGWNAVVDGKSATWTGGSLPPKQTASFGIALKADVDPGTATLQAEQRYDGGAVVSWPVTLTITPAAETPSENLALAGVVGVIGVLLVAAIAMLAWRRRSSAGA